MQSLPYAKGGSCPQYSLCVRANRWFQLFLIYRWYNPWAGAFRVCAVPVLDSWHFKNHVTLLWADPVPHSRRPTQHKTNSVAFWSCFSPFFCVLTSHVGLLILCFYRRHPPQQSRRISVGGTFQNVNYLGARTRVIEVAFRLLSPPIRLKT